MDELDQRGKALPVARVLKRINEELNKAGG